MRNLAILSALGLGIFFAGCSGDVKISCNNQTLNTLLVTDAVNAEIESGKTKEFNIKKNSCLAFQEIKKFPDGTIEYLKDTSMPESSRWKFDHGRRCFDQSNQYTFYAQP